MIPRYSRPEMVAIWQPATRFQIWFDIEAHAADAMAELGVIPKVYNHGRYRFSSYFGDMDRPVERSVFAGSPAALAGLWQRLDGFLVSLRHHV